LHLLVISYNTSSQNAYIEITQLGINLVLNYNRLKLIG